MAIWAKDKHKQRLENEKKKEEERKNGFREEFEKQAMKFKKEAYGKCMLCERTFEPADEFKNSPDAYIEYMISLICHKCQDNMFSKER